MNRKLTTKPHNVSFSKYDIEYPQNMMKLHIVKITKTDKAIKIQEGW